MATMRLIPSTSAVSTSSYMSISNASNMYANTDSTTYGTITHYRYGTSNTYYAYIRGFNFDDLPSAAEVSDFTVKIKASATGHTTSTSTNYKMTLCNNTSSISNTYASGILSTTVTTFTFSEGSLTWDQIVGYGSNFGIRIPLRRASSTTAAVASVYGAEIEVTYTVPNPRTITTSLTGDGTISPSGSNIYYDGHDFDLTITPTDKSASVTATKNGTDITSQLVAHGVEVSEDRVLGTYTLVSGGFNGSGATYFSGIVGHGVNGSQTTSNYYSSGSGTQAVFTYDMGFSNIPSNANINRVYCEVNGHAESTSNTNEYMCVQLRSGNTDLSEEINYKDIGTDNTTITLECENLPTVSQLQSMVLQCTLGYYGGAINGATCYVEYDTGGSLDHYTYSMIISEDATIIVTIGGGGGDEPELYIKSGSSWVKVTAAYKKVNGSWVQQSDLTTVFQSGVNYRKGS